MNSDLRECKCLDKVREKLTAHYGDGSSVELELKQTIDMETMTLGAALPPLHFSYLHRKKNGKTQPAPVGDVKR